MNISDTSLMSSRIIANKRSAACDLEGEMVILNLDSGIYFGLNPVGAAIWNYVQSERSLEDIVGYLLVEYQVDRARCETEVISLLHQMSAQGLVEIQANAQAA